MTGDVLVVAEGAGDTFVDSTFELIGRARLLAEGWGGRVLALVIGPAPDPAALGADLVLTVAHPSLTAYSPEAFLEVLHAVVAEWAPKLVLMANTTAGMDLGAGLSIRWGRPLAAYVTDVTAEGEEILATSLIHGGKLLAEVVLEGGQGICTVAAGSFPAPPRQDRSADVQEVSPPASLGVVATTCLGSPERETDDVDVTRAAVLVGIGRGLGSAENVALAERLADALGASVSGTSQVCDLGWLPRTRHVGKSGVKVRPRAYLSFGISGAPEHLEGIRESELIVACNTDGAAPIFDAAHYGTTVDALELIRALTERAGA